MNARKWARHITAIALSSLLASCKEQEETPTQGNTDPVGLLESLTASMVISLLSLLVSSEEQKEVPKTYRKLMNVNTNTR